jgi:pimeloyl-ACP methyl ester carboxylesterase
MEADIGKYRQVEAAYAALIARYAPDTRIRRLRWSQGETRVLELGDGPPLLYVHGGLGGAFEIVPILPALARSHRVIAVDRPGHGMADPFGYTGVDLLEHARTFLSDILDVLELPAVDVVASSIGGLWSAAFALDDPERVCRLALVGAAAGVTRDVPLQLRLLCLPLIGQPLGRLLMSRPTREGSRKFWGQILVTHPERLDDTLLDADVASQRRHIESHLSLARCVGDAGGIRRSLILGERWQALTVPTAVLCGDRDAFAPASVRKAWDTIAARNPQIQLIRIPGAGHLPWLDEPEFVVGEIERFLSAEAHPGRPAVSSGGVHAPPVVLCLNQSARSVA